MKTWNSQKAALALALLLRAHLAALDLDLNVVSSYTFTNASTHSITVSGDFAYTQETLWQSSANEQKRVSVFDIRNPASPQRIGNYEIPRWATVHFSAKYAFVGSDALSIVDLSDPTELREVGKYPLGAYEIVVSGNYGYLLTSSGLTIIDVSNPQSPLFVGSVDVLTGNPVALAVSGKFAFVTEHRFQGTMKGFVHVLDVSDPTKPRPLGTYAVDGPLSHGSIAVSTDTAFLVQQQNLIAIDFKDPVNPRRIGSLEMNVNGADDPKLTLNRSNLYVAAGWGGLQVIDVSDPANLRTVGTYAPEGIAAFQGVAISGDYAFTAHGEHGVGVINIANPADPAWVGGHYDGWTPRHFDGTDEAGRSSGLFLVDNRAYVVTEDAGVHVFDISIPDEPVRIGTWKPHTWSTHFAFAGKQAFIADPAAGIEIFDLTDLAAPRHVSTIQSGGNPQSLATSENHLFVADGTNGLVIFDVSRPATPWVAGKLQSAGSAYAISVSGSYAGVSYDQTKLGGTTELVIVDVHDPENPVHVTQSYDSLGTEITVSGDYVYWFGQEMPGSDSIIRYGPSLIRTNISLSAVPMCSPPGAFLLDTPHEEIRGNYGLAAAGSYVVWFGRDRLVVLNTGVPHQSECVGSFLPKEFISSIAARERYLYLVEGEQLKVIHLTAANPQRRAVDFSIENVDRVQVAGDYGFVSHRDAKELSIIDFSAPTNPRLLGGYTSTNLVIDLALEGSLGFSLEYLADDIPGILRIIDFSDPANPLVKSSHETESPVNLSWMPLFGKLAVCPGRVFVLAYHSLNSSDRTGGVEIFNISNLENPMRIGRYSMPPSGVPTVPVNFAVRDNFLYLIRAGGFRGAAVPECCGFGLELEIVDMEDPLSPVALSSHAFGQGFSTSTHEVDASVALLKDHAFVLDPEGVITIFDISRPTEIKPVGSYHSLLIPPFGLTLAGSRLYLHSSTKLEVLDIRDPENPKHIGGNSNLDLQVAPNRTFSLAVRSGQIFAPAGASGLLILHDYKPLHFEQVIRNNSGTAHLRLSGPPGVPGAVQRSSDLRHWNDWLQVNFSEDVTELSDVKNENVSANFYRIVAP